MNFATWSVRNPIPSLMLFAFLTVAGILGFQNLNIQYLPDLDLPTINVELVQPGAAPAQLETEVARKVEDAMAALQGLEHLRTTITDGRVSISAEFELERPLTEALLDVKDAIDKVRNELPRDLEEPQIYKVTLNHGGPMVTYAVSAPTMNEEALSWFVDDTIARTVLSVPGIAEFSRVGGVSREIQVTVDPFQLTALGVTATDVSRALKRVQQDASGGRGEIGGLEQGVRTLATVARAEDLKALPIVLADGRSLRLDQVATVADTQAERHQAALLDGKSAVGFQVFRTKGYDEKSTTEAVVEAMAQLQREHPDLEVTTVQTSWLSTSQQYHASMQMLIEGAILAVIVIWLFLRDWRATLIGAIALPLSIIPTFAFMNWFDFSLNTVTLLGLAVVVGILVDDAVVEVENIARHLAQGKSVHDATVEAVNEIALAVIATTATLVVVFLPTALMSGFIGLVFKQFGWTVVVAVLASLLVARLLTPMMATWILRGGHREQPSGKLMNHYMRSVAWCLAHRRITMMSGMAFFVASLAIVPLLPISVLPPEDHGVVTINMELPPGTNLQTSVDTAEALRVSLKDVPGVAAIFTTIGSARAGTPVSSGAAGEVRKGKLTLVLEPMGERPSQLDIEHAVRPWLEKVPGARWSLGTGSPGEKLDILLAGQDARVLTATAREIERELRSLPFLSSVTSSASLERPEVTVRPDPVLAAQQGVSTEAIGETLRIALAGDFDASLAKLDLDRRQIDIRVEVPKVVRTDLERIGDLRVHGDKGLVPLSSVATLSMESGPSQIDRYNRERQVSISGDLGGYPIGRAMAARDALPSMQAIPASVRLVEVGDAQIMSEMLSGFGFALLTGILLVYAVLVLLFKDWFLPVTILSSVPLAICGAFMAMFIGQCDLGMPTLIGLVMLLGIVTKNSILLVDFAIIAQRDLGLSLHDAILDACHKRARPIVMTTVAMLAGLIPLRFGFAGDGGLRQPMAIAVIGGLITSTALSLLVVPVVFIYISRLESWLVARKRRLIGSGAEVL